MTYEIPVDGYEGRVQLQTVARRIARACVHFLQVSTCPALLPSSNSSLVHVFDSLVAGKHDPHLMGPCHAIPFGGELTWRVAACSLHELNEPLPRSCSSLWTISLQRKICTTS